MKLLLCILLLFLASVLNAEARVGKKKECYQWFSTCRLETSILPDIPCADQCHYYASKVSGQASHVCVGRDGVKPTEWDYGTEPIDNEIKCVCTTAVTVWRLKKDCDFGTYDNQVCNFPDGVPGKMTGKSWQLGKVYC